MLNIEKIYEELTNVNISEQCELWNERGKGYYGEYLLFKELYPTINGCCKILMNINIPTSNGRTTEIDLLFIHETGLYVFEVKHYKGTIYGKENDLKWTQYFRTEPNCTFYNPIKQNHYHIEALKSKFNNIPIHSYIVFTNPDCELRVQCDNPQITVCGLWDLSFYMQKINSKPQILNIESIDNIFNSLLQFSPKTQKTIITNVGEIPLYQYINEIAKDYIDNKNDLEKTYNEKFVQMRKKTIKTILLSVASGLVCALLSTLTCIIYSNYSNNKVDIAYQEIDAFKQKFERIELTDVGNVVLNNDFITTSDVSVVNSQDIQNTVNLYFTLNWNGENYGASVKRDTNIIIICKDGSVKEYPLDEKSFPYASSNLRMGKGTAWYSAYTKYEFPVQELRGIDIDNIAYIKLSYLDVWKIKNTSSALEPIVHNYEVMIYQIDENK